MNHWTDQGIDDSTLGPAIGSLDSPLDRPWDHWTDHWSNHWTKRPKEAQRGRAWICITSLSCAWLAGWLTWGLADWLADPKGSGSPKPKVPSFTSNSPMCGLGSQPASQPAKRRTASFCPRSAFMYVCVYVCMGLSTNFCMYVCMYICMFVGPPWPVFSTDQICMCWQVAFYRAPNPEKRPPNLSWSPQAKMSPVYQQGTYWEAS